MISKYFERQEFECKCGCGFATVDFELLNILERLREYYGKPIKINSGCRCKIYNKSIGGSSGSRHMEGVAADIDILEIHPEEVQTKLGEWYPDAYGLGKYKTFTHIDSRTKKARWNG